MAKFEYSAAGSFLSERKRHSDTVMAFVLSLLLSALIPFLMMDGNNVLVIGGGFAFLAFAVFLLSGNIFKWGVYCFFCFQYTMSYFFMPTATVIIGSSLLFFPLALSGRNSLSVFCGIPNKKSLLLMLLGGVISFSYMIFVNYGELKYYIQYDIYFIFGLIFAYQIYFLLKLKMLDPQKLVECIGFSAVVIIGILIMQYVRYGLDLMFTVRFGSIVMPNENPNTLACYINIALPCAFFTAFFEKQNLIKKVIFWGLSLFYVSILLMTESRGALPGIAILLAYFIWHKRGNKILLTAIFICVMFLVFIVGENVIQRTFSPSASDVMSNIGRFDYWRAAFKILRDNLYFFGIGMHNYSLMKYDYGISRMMNIDAHTHNVLLDVWVGWGLLGLLGWLIFNAVIVKSLLPLRKNCSMASSVIFAVLLFFVYGLVECGINRPRIMVAYFALIGVGFFLKSQTNSDAKRKLINDT